MGALKLVDRVLPKATKTHDVFNTLVAQNTILVVYVLAPIAAVGIFRNHQCRSKEDAQAM